ncbi:MAG: NAD(P)H-hydrate dehydratase [Arenicellales bacterium]
MREVEGPVYRIEQIREIEAQALARIDEPGSLMMKAARGALFRLRQCWPTARSLTIFCGAGNNGGDGYALARLARRDGYAVQVVGIAPSTSAEAQLHRQAWLSEGGQFTQEMGDAVMDGDVLVDALLGIGFRGELRADYVDAITVMNGSARPVLAIDVPSGVSADSGGVAAVAVRSTVTVTFIGIKPGLVTGPALDHCGTVLLEDLGLSSDRRWGNIISVATVSGLRTVRKKNFHKGRAGHIGIVGAGPGMPGAAALCAMAALKSGVGKVTVGCHPISAQAVAAQCPEAIVRGLTSPKDVQELLGDIDVLALGPGLGKSEWSRMVFAPCLEAELPKVIDADGLNLLAHGENQSLKAVLTPHPGEAARMLGRSTGDIEADRPDAAEALAIRFNSTAVLKGAGTLIKGLDLPAWVCPRGNPGMASAGMGDVLTGVVAGFRGQGLCDVDSAVWGVWCHASAGDLAAREVGLVGFLASDVIDRIPVVRDVYA